MDELIKAARKDMEEYASYAEKIAEKNLIKILEAFRAENVSTQHFCSTTGYGYNDMGRDKLEALYARVFGTEAALVRQQIVSGSHAISLALFGNLLPGDELLLLGMPYDTLQTVIGIGRDIPCSLSEYGVKYRVYDLDFVNPNLSAIKSALRPETKMVSIQRSRGYSSRMSLSVAKIAALIDAVKSVRPDIIVFVDNCYGELVETKEPGDIGADIVVGSLMKNLGGGIAPTGGYVAGNKDLVYEVAQRLTAPGIGKDLGANFNLNNAFFKGVFMAPNAVKNALKTAIFTSYMLEKLGYEHVSPCYNEKRTDLIQTLDLHSKEKLVNFTQGIQSSSPIDSFVRVLPAPMPGYPFDEVMASGSFTQGSTIELSADAPVKEPYTLYMQGGLSIEYGKLSILLALTQMKNK